MLWIVAAANCASPGTRLLSGQVKGTDFLHFYALARIGASEPAQFANSAAVRQAQLTAVPDSGDHKYPPVYGPQVAIALSPLATLDYIGALRLWVLITALAYFASIALVWKHSTVLAGHFWIVMVGAAGFPPFWYLLQYGQLSVVPLAVAVAAWCALRKRQPFATGLAFGLLMFKPPLFAPVFAVLVLSGSWVSVAGMVVSAAAEVGLSALWVGTAGLVNYAQLLLALPRMAQMMAAKPDQMHSLRAFWTLLFGESTITLVLYGLTAALALFTAAQIWRRATNPSIRMSALLLATVLASPHLYVYDLVLLAPVWIWLTEWYLTEQLSISVGRALYVGYLAALFGGVTLLVPIQLSVLCSVYFLVYLAQWVLKQRQ